MILPISGLFIILISKSVNFVHGESEPKEARVVHGLSVESMRQFTHHVTIEATFDNKKYYCSGSVVAEQWIVTSTSCVRNMTLLKIHFQFLGETSQTQGVTVLVSRRSILNYPTNSNGVALVKLHVKLIFDDDIQPVPIANENYIRNREFAILAGFDHSQTSLKYGLFQIIDAEVCLQHYPTKFNKISDICVKGWGYYENVPCDHNEGAGLIVHWPKHPKLVGIFMKRTECEAKKPHIVVKTHQFINWINYTIADGFTEKRALYSETTEITPETT